MNYLKLQQDLMAEVHNAAPRPPSYIAKDINLCEYVGDVCFTIHEDSIILVNSVGSAAYVVPRIFSYLDKQRLTALDSNLFKRFKLADCTPLTATGMSQKDEKKRTRVIFKRDEEPVHLDQKLLKYFGAGAKFYQKGDFDPVIVTELTGTKAEQIVGYIFPLRLHEKDKKLNQ